MEARKGLSDHALKLFSSDLEAYCKVCLQIRDKNARQVPLTLNDAQQIVHQKLRDQYATEGRIRAIVLKARQEGVSTYTAARFFRRLTMMPNQYGIVIADEERRGKDLFDIYDRFHSYLPDEVRPMVRYTAKQTQLVFDNPDDRKRKRNPGLGSKITVETANDANTARGSTNQMVHASEMGMWKNGEEVWVSIMQSVPDQNSEVIIESTAKGVGNFFHSMWVSAQEGENGYIPIFLPWWVDKEYSLALTSSQRKDVKNTLDDLESSYVNEGIEFEGVRHKLTLGQIAWRRMTIRDKLAGDERTFRQEYPSNPDEAFLVSGNTFIEDDVLKKYNAATEKPVMRANLARIGGGIVAKRANMGYLRIWDKPSQNGKYVIGADTAMGKQVGPRIVEGDIEKGGTDFSSADVFDVSTRKQVAQLHGRMAPEVFAQQLYYLGHYYSTPNPTGTRTPALLAVEKNYNSGETVLRLLQQSYLYPNLYRARRINRRHGKNQMEDRMGWITSPETRMPMLDELARSMRMGTITIPNPDTMKELLTFVRWEDGVPRAQEGAHDDRVISLAIAVEVSRTALFAMPEFYDETTLTKTGNSPSGLFSY